MSLKQEPKFRKSIHIQKFVVAFNIFTFAFAGAIVIPASILLILSGNPNGAVAELISDCIIINSIASALVIIAWVIYRFAAYNKVKNAACTSP